MMRCPECKEKNQVYFDGLFFKCSKCGLIEWVRDNYEALKKRWEVGIIDES